MWGSQRNAPSRRLSSVDSGPNTLRPSGAWARPRRAIRAAPRPSTREPPRRTSPRVGDSVPEIARIVVVLPAPLAPISATIVPGLTSSEVPTSTSERPYPAWRSVTVSMQLRGSGGGSRRGRGPGRRGVGLGGAEVGGDDLG